MLNSISSTEVPADLFISSCGTTPSHFATHLYISSTLHPVFHLTCGVSVVTDICIIICCRVMFISPSYARIYVFLMMGLVPRTEACYQMLANAIFF